MKQAPADKKIILKVYDTTGTGFQAVDITELVWGIVEESIKVIAKEAIDFTLEKLKEEGKLKNA